MDSPIKMICEDIWVKQIFPFVGAKKYAFVAPVSKEMKQLYLSYCATSNEKVFADGDRWRCSIYAREPVSCHTSKLAAVESVSCAKFWYDQFNNDDSTEICDYAAKAGNLEVLKWARTMGLPWASSTCNSAARHGHLETLKYAHTRGCPWILEWLDFGEVAHDGHLSIFKYAYEVDPSSLDCTVITPYAIYGDHPEIVEFFHDKNIWDEWTCIACAQMNDLEMLKYVRGHGCPWDKETCEQAVERGHLDILKYAHENGCPWDEDTPWVAACCDQLEALKYAHRNGCPWDSRVREYGKGELLKWAIENGCP